MMVESNVVSPVERIILYYLDYCATKIKNSAIEFLILVAQYPLFPSNLKNVFTKHLLSETSFSKFGAGCLF